MANRLQKSLESVLVADDKLFYILTLFSNDFVHLVGDVGQFQVLNREASRDLVSEFQNRLGSPGWTVGVHVFLQLGLEVVFRKSGTLIDDVVKDFVPNLHVVDEHLILLQHVLPVSELCLVVNGSIVVRQQLLQGFHVPVPLAPNVGSFSQRSWKLGVSKRVTTLQKGAGSSRCDFGVSRRSIE